MLGCIVDEDPEFTGPKLQLLIVSKRYPYIMISTVDSLSTKTCTLDIFRSAQMVYNI
jgi:hypothetical protein